jgi:glutamate-1-semialdehyde 2,1-aminomutase
MAAGLATLQALRKPGTYEALEARSRTLADGFAERAAAAGIELTTAAVGGMFGFFFHPGPVRDFDDAKKANGARFRRFFHLLLDAGVYLPPSAFEACFVSLAHRPADVAATLAAAERAFRTLRREEARAR